MSALAKKLNAGLNLQSKLAVVAGGSQGIGKGVALRFAQAGSSVIVIGRNEQLLAQTVRDCEQAAASGSSSGSEQTFQYIKADLSIIPGMKAAIKEINEKSKGSVNYLVQTQGGPPNGKYLDHFGHEMHFAVQILSRFALAEALASSKVLKEASVNVCAPGGSQTEFDLEDIECRSYKNRNRLAILAAMASSQGLITDTYTKALQSRYPSISFFHVFPGIVTTNSASNQGFPFPLPQLFSLASPIISRTIGNSPESYSDVPVLLAANESTEKVELVQREGKHLNERLKGVKTAPWSNERTNQDATFAKLHSFLYPSQHPQ